MAATRADIRGEWFVERDILYPPADRAGATTTMLFSRGSSYSSAGDFYIVLGYDSHD
jgi:hypothetical protein